MVYQSILDAVGRTPLVKLHRVTSNLPGNYYAKVEFFNPGGSIKDRIGHQMILDAEKSGRIKPGDTLIEPTSGNTGIGLALAGAVKGYRVIITMPEKMSREKQVVLEALGAEIIRTPTEAAWDAPESHIGVAKRLQKELPNAHILDQYANPSNPKAHYDHTATEIIEQLDGTVDMVVMGAGTGGTISGVARKIRETFPSCKIIGADPVGSILAGGSHVASYKIEGIGYDFIPDVLDRELVDEWVKTTDRKSFQLARRIIREEGLLVGGSSGSALQAAFKAGTKLKEGQNCVIIFPDGVRNYMTKFVDDRWMQECGFYGPDALTGSVEEIVSKKKMRKLITIQSGAQIHEAIDVMRDASISQLPVVKKEKIVGLVSETDLLQYLSSSDNNTKGSVDQVMSLSVPTVELHTPISALQVILQQAGSAIVLDQDNHPIQILTTIDLVEWMARAT